MVSFFYHTAKFRASCLIGDIFFSPIPDSFPARPCLTARLASCINPLAHYAAPHWVFSPWAFPPLLAFWLFLSLLPHGVSCSCSFPWTCAGDLCCLRWLILLTPNFVRCALGSVTIVSFFSSVMELCCLLGDWDIVTAACRLAPPPCCCLLPSYVQLSGLPLHSAGDPFPHQSRHANHHPVFLLLRQ